jgi:hypothetical protein
MLWQRNRDIFSGLRVIIGLKQEAFHFNGERFT